MKTTKNGGARPGAGRKKGGKNPATLSREEALRQFRERVQDATSHLQRAQMGLAVGSQYLFKKVKGTEDPILVKDVWEIEAYLRGDYEGGKDTYYFMTTKDPDNRALDSLFNRTYGKPQDSIDITSGGEPITTVEILLDHGQDSD